MLSKILIILKWEHLILPLFTKIGGQWEAGEMIQQLWGTAFSEDLSLDFSTNIVAHEHLYLQFPEIGYSLLTSVGTRHVHHTHTYVQANHSCL